MQLTGKNINAGRFSQSAGQGPGRLAALQAVGTPALFEGVWSSFSSVLNCTVAALSILAGPPRN